MIILVLGRREQGKSTFAYNLALRKETRVIFDPRALFATTSDRIPSAFGLYDLMEERSEVIVQPDGMVKRAFYDTSREVWDWIKHYKGDDSFEISLSFLVDEARFVDTPSFIPDEFDAILRMAPRKEVDVILTAHRPVDISTDIRAIADYWIVFQTTQEHDLKVITERCGAECAAIVQSLPQHHALIWNDALGKFRVENRPETWKRDIKALPRNIQHEGEMASHAIQ